MKQHPEQHDGELYMGNTDLHGFHKYAWTSKRLGRVAYYADGRKIPKDVRSFGSDLRPWFILASEVEQAIASEEASRGPNFEEKIRVYQSMLTERGVTS